MRVIIVGAGPGGLSAAIGLERAGVDVALFDRAGDLGSIQLGGGVHLWNNGMRALRELGVAERVQGAGEPVVRFAWSDSRGKLIGAGDVQEVTRELGVPAMGLSRRDLHTALAESLQSTKLELGVQCTGFEQDGSGVLVRFDGGREERGDVLVGADGMQSVVRRQLLGEAPLRYSGIVVCQAIVDDPALLSPRDTYGLLWGRGVRFGFYPVAGGSFWYALVASKSRDFAGSGPKKEAVRRKIAGWAEPSQRLVEATDESAIVRGELSGREPVSRWGEGRVTLLGDAAHAMTPFLGQGAGQAIEDAAVLTRVLPQAEDIPAALRRYEAERIPRTSDVTERAWKVGQATAMSNPIACAVRNQVTRRIFPRVVWPQLKRIISYDF